MIKKYGWNIVFAYLAATVLCGAMIVYRVLFSNSGIYNFLVWNVFLAWIPLCAAFLLHGIVSKKTRTEAVREQRPSGRAVAGIAKGAAVSTLSVVWLLFFPNSSYIVTDIIHLIRLGETYRDPFFIADARIWYDLIMFISVAFTSHGIGLYSLFIVHRLLRKTLAAPPATAVTLAFIFLAGFGVYLGRFVRLNSWDVLHDLPSILSIVSEHAADPGAANFTGLFGAFILLTYLPYYAFLRERRDKGA